jgi:putative DNA primase/helicase
VNEILALMATYDLNPGYFQIDGKIHRFKVDGDKGGRKSGWVTAFQNNLRNGGEIFYGGMFGNYRTQLKETFSTAREKMSAEDRKFLQDKMAKAQKAHRDSVQKLQEETALRVGELWDALDIEGPSDYLVRKQIADCPDLNIRFNGIGDFYVKVQDIEGKVWSLQRILSKPDSQGRTKLFEYGGRVEGCFNIIGDIEGQPVLYVAEGFATAATIHKATGATVVCAFNAGNLKSVATALRKKGPNQVIVICGDDDQWTYRPDKSKWNPGREAAEEAGREIGAKYIFPVINNCEEKKLKDWNDLHCEQSIDDVRSQILASDPEKLPVSFDRSYIMNSPYDDQTEKGGKKGTYENFKELMRRLNVTIRYNVISKEDEVLIPGMSFTEDNRLVASLGYLLSWHARIDLPSTNIGTYITSLADQNLYNPVATWITSKPWDGVSRLQDIYDTITARDEGKHIHLKFMKERLILLWMISAVAAACKPDGHSSSGVLVLQGDQNLGKTSWFKKLAPASLRVIADGLSLNTENKDSVTQAVSNWIVELGELDATFKSDMSRLKAFLTRSRDVVRRPYAAKDSKYPRRTVFFGSVNPENFLKDPTGNRRFWTIACVAINYKHGIDMQQLWAEIYEEFFLKGHTCNLSEEELLALNEKNKDHEEICPIEELIREEFDWDNEQKTIHKKEMTATEICKAIGIREPNESDVKKSGIALKKISQIGQKRNGQKRFYLIPIKQNRSQLDF